MSSEKSNYTETKREKFGMSEITRRYDNGDVEKRLEEFDWGKRKQVVRNRKVTHPNGSSEEYNFEGLKSVETLADGTVRQFYRDGSVKSERLPDGTERWFYDDGKICGEVTKQGIERLYYENGNVSRMENPATKHTVGYAKSGGINFEIKDKQVYINPEYFSYYKIGIKTDITTEHWAENMKLNPHKKTLICLGGDASTSAKAANGNINAALDALGFSSAECEGIQLAACYRPRTTSSLELALRKAEINRAKLAAEDYQKEIRRAFMPFVAQKHGKKYARLADKELFKRFRNIMLFTHCAGADDVPIIEKTLKRMMTELGYGTAVQKYALRQMLCVTNNNQREFTKDKSEMTVLHRYSVLDGQNSANYNAKCSDDYGVFLEKYPPFHQFKGRAAGIINLRKNEALMIFDKVMRYGSEHNAGFFTPEHYMLTKVGKQQARLMQNIGQYWLKNMRAVPSAQEVIRRGAENDAELQAALEKAFAVGRKTKRAKISPLENPAILKAAFYKFDKPWIEAEPVGVAKLLDLKTR